MESAEAVAKVGQWLRAVHGPDVSEPGGAGVRVDHEKVLRIPEGWSVPYNTTAYLDEGHPEKEIFPPPSVIVREPDGELRQAHPHPGGLSIPVAYPGQEAWREVVDPEYSKAGLGELGVPLQAVAGWVKVAADGVQTGEERENPEYGSGPIRRGYPKPDNRTETLLLFASVGWLTREQLLIGLLRCEVYVPLDLETGKTSRFYFNEDRGELKVFSSTKHLPSREHGYWKVDLATLAGFESPPNLVINGGPATFEDVSGAELAEIARRFPRREAHVDVNGRCPEAEEDLERVARDTAVRMGLAKPVEPPLRAAELARRRGFELTVEECQKTVLGESWLRRLDLPEPSPGRPNDLRANGLATTYDNEGRPVPRLDTFGKYFEHDNTHARFGWQRVAGAYVGFALGEAMGAAVDRLRLDEIHNLYGPDGVTDLPVAFDQPGRIGPLTQRLLFYTEAVIRSPHREKPESREAEQQLGSVVRGALQRWLHTQGAPLDNADGWLVKVPELQVRRTADDAELNAWHALATVSPHSVPMRGPDALVAALPSAMTVSGSGSALSGGSRQAVRTLAGVTHPGEVELVAATYLTSVFEQALTGEAFSFPVWNLSREIFDDADPRQSGPVWADLKAMVAESVPFFGKNGLPALRVPELIGDGLGTLPVLGRAFAALSGFENYPEQALLRAVNHSGRSALTGALAGALLGARTGIPGLPQKWLEQLELRYLIENLASDAFWHFDRQSALNQLGQEWAQRYPRW
ncbi:ADP-ribosylglycohydrolase family protein [Amycolatopsis sp. H20-H5]|uniref:ADP-ribosylglycohydrolase family protein n=1 Tax=Amycolatopsis sp. H20-H5 TaxID=3046309 RepID=UPI002DB7A497|nr:ADP-ribosylglycohydrolase family protein [Amycolatopsis sp. H20-H5]MEC3974642.1 ADP-ribosylglycohydrolase family protein [Amycolatopsis sp. H20-H5]